MGLCLGIKGKVVKPVGENRSRSVARKRAALDQKVRDTDLLARIHSGFNTFTLRRSLKEVRATLAEVLADKATQAHAS